MRKQRRMRRRLRRSMVFVTLLMVVFCVCVCVRTRSLQAQVQENDEVVQLLKDQIAVEEERAQGLSEQEQYMQTKAYVEEIAHEKLGLVYPDEIFIKVSDK